ncbi:hypothetical protein N3553_25640, partial [Pantoea dispersa]|uniref:hypothetical protein n=1 Tax=Pantoea dispersa TaxID=59814 RepID=UPI0021AF2A1C
MELPTAAAASAARLLKPGGYFVMEHAEVQAGWIAGMLRRTGRWNDVTTHSGARVTVTVGLDVPLPMVPFGDS